MEDSIIMYDVKDLAKIFKCGINHAYSITKVSGFPSMRIGGKILTEKKSLENWLQKNNDKSILL